MLDFDSEIKKVFADGESKATKLRALFAKSDDLISVVLRGHLIIEELLFTACAAYCQDPDQLKSARLRYPQLVSLLRALEKIPAVPPSYWAVLLELNSLRNVLAHQLEHKDLEKRVARFVKMVSETSTEYEFPETDAPKEALQKSLSFLIGGLEVVAVWHAGLEVLLRHRALGVQDET